MDYYDDDPSDQDGETKDDFSDDIEKICDGNGSDDEKSFDDTNIKLEEYVSLSESDEDVQKEPIVKPQALIDIEELFEYNIISEQEYNNRVSELFINEDVLNTINNEEESKTEIDHVTNTNTEEEEVYRYEEIENKDGTFTTKTYTTNNEGQRILITRLIKREIVTKKVPKSVIQRRNILKFGRCIGSPSGPEEGVTTFGDLVVLEKSQTTNNTTTQSTTQKPVSSFTSVVKCRNCNESGHWTKDCPHRKESLDVIRSITTTLPPSIESSTNGSYVPPHLRRTQSNSSDHPQHYSQDHSQLQSLKVINLDFEASEQDLRILFEHFGKVKRATIVKDHRTRESKGMGYVDMLLFEDGEKAIEKLHGYLYGNQVLHVEWAKPRNKR